MTKKYVTPQEKYYQTKMKEREKKVTLRLYKDKPEDVPIIEFLDSRLVKNEVIKEAIRQFMKRGE